MYYRLLGTLALLLYHTQTLSMLSRIIRVKPRIVQAHLTHLPSNLQFYSTQQLEQRTQKVKMLQDDIERFERMISEAEYNLGHLENPWSFQKQHDIHSTSLYYDETARNLQIIRIYQPLLKNRKREIANLKH